MGPVIASIAPPLASACGTCASTGNGFGEKGTGRILSVFRSEKNIAVNPRIVDKFSERVGIDMEHFLS